MKDLENVLASFVRRSEEILRGNLAGIYLHGSAVMGCFNPAKSDIDLIIVVNEPLSDHVKTEYMNMVVELNADGPAKGIEMSVVTKSVCKPFVYPTPFELHFSVMHLEWYQTAPDDYIAKMKGTDTDLAAHFTIIKHRGKCLCGLPIDQVFADVPAAYYFDSIHDDIADAAEYFASVQDAAADSGAMSAAEISARTMYLTLNLARVLAYKQEGLILSKQEGGEWALRTLPPQFHTLIRRALTEYVQGSADLALAQAPTAQAPAEQATAQASPFDIESAQAYATYMLKLIEAQI